MERHRFALEELCCWFWRKNRRMNIEGKIGFPNPFASIIWCRCCIVMYVIAVYICNDFRKNHVLLLSFEFAVEWWIDCVHAMRFAYFNDFHKNHVILSSLILLCRWPSDWVVVCCCAVNVCWLWFLNSNYVRWRTCPGFILSGGRLICFGVVNC